MAPLPSPTSLGVWGPGVVLSAPPGPPRFCPCSPVCGPHPALLDRVPSTAPSKSLLWWEGALSWPHHGGRVPGQLPLEGAGVYVVSRGRGASHCSLGLSPLPPAPASQAHRGRWAERAGRTGEGRGPPAPVGPVTLPRARPGCPVAGACA